jgi:beta-glucosidase
MPSREVPFRFGAQSRPSPDLAASEPSVIRAGISGVTQPIKNPVSSLPRVTKTAGKPAAPKTIGDDFLFGAAVASYQVEAGLHRSDWHKFEGRRGLLGTTPIKHKDRADDGPVFAKIEADGTIGGAFRAYLAKAKEMGHTAFRFSIDWSRIQPEKDGPYDPKAIALYKAILAECKKNGLEPMVTLQHFTLPIWASDMKDPEAKLGGWAGPPGSTPGEAPIVGAFAKFAKDMAKELGEGVKLFVTINEPVVFALGAYVAGAFPGPGKKLQFDLARRAIINMAHAHARAYDAIKSVRPDAQVGVAQHVRRYVPASGSEADRAAAEQLDYLANALFLDAATSGDADWNGDGRFDGPSEGKGIDALKDRLDFVGINYYSRNEVAASPIPLGPKDMRIRGLPKEMIAEVLPLPKRRGATRTDVGWEIYPEGLHQSLVWAKERFDRPIYVTENGIAEGVQPDVKRPKFIVDHIEAMERAMKDGADVRGYLHWSLMDNFEWHLGFEPRFGLLRVDYTDPSRPFAETDGAKAYAEIIAAKGVTPTIRAKWAKEPASEPTLSERVKTWLGLRAPVGT